MKRICDIHIAVLLSVLCAVVPASSGQDRRNYRAGVKRP